MLIESHNSLEDDENTPTTNNEHQLQKRNSLTEIINNKMNDQDFMQRMNVASILVLEIYRVLTGAFLLLFVPQKCNNELCGMFEHFHSTNPFTKCVLAFNGLTMLFFFFLYGVEINREHKLIHYLEVTRTKPVDNESVGKELKHIELSKIKKIWNLDKYYYHIGMGSSCMFIINTLLSALFIFRHVYDSKTYSVFLTNILFMGMKVYDVYDIVNTKKNVFYSAYIKARTQFNDVDPEKRISHLENEVHV